MSHLRLDYGVRPEDVLAQYGQYPRWYTPARNRRPRTRRPQPSATHMRFDPCSYCGGLGGTLDHIAPGTGNGWENLTGACTSCNQRKADSSLLRFMLGEAA